MLTDRVLPTSPAVSASAPRAIAPVLSLHGIAKHFGAVAALADVGLEFRAGEIHALLGENGAGKSTLMHIIAGVLRPDGGTISLDGRPTRFASADDARRAGIGMVHQHFTLADALPVIENLALSLAPAKAWRYPRAAVAAAARALAQRVGLELSPLDTPVAQLPVGARQRLEILKALASAGRILILDEPTAVLTPAEVQQLFSILRALRTEGRAILFITHKLREVKDIADRVTIMRRGRVVGTYETAQVSEGALAERMIGALATPHPRLPPPAHRRVMLCATRLCTAPKPGATALQAVSFAVCGGEILGIAGVDGNGQRELFEVLVGLTALSAGSLDVADRPLQRFTPRVALYAGVGHIPPDRQRDGLVLPMTVWENLLLRRTILDQFSRCGFVRRGAARRFAGDLARRYAIRLSALDAPAQSLSGGNQQRVVVARELSQPLRVLVAVNPTRGLDIAAAGAVANGLLDAAAAGTGILLISTDLDEVLELSDRIAVLARGRLSDSLPHPIAPERLGLLMAGAAA